MRTYLERNRLGELMVLKGHISAGQLKDVLRAQKNKKTDRTNPDRIPLYFTVPASEYIMAPAFAQNYRRIFTLHAFYVLFRV